uniref:Uncharacterized protein n=1 Tax=Arundo donax TaxID=35708 RepID=A0A0A8XYP9_ARUDO
MSVSNLCDDIIVVGLVYDILQVGHESICCVAIRHIVVEHSFSSHHQLHFQKAFPVLLITYTVIRSC